MPASAEVDPHVGCIIVAAGSGSRLAADRPKAFVELAGRTLLEHAVSRVVAAGVGEVVVAVPERMLATAADLVAGFGCFQPPRADAGSPAVRVVTGGADRQASVAAALSVLSPDVDTVLVHDAARALAPAALVARVISAVRDGHRAVVPGLPVADTIKQVDSAGQIVATVDREPLRIAQTPQGFQRDLLVRAHGQREPAAATDDAALVERLGEPVFVVAGHPDAFKVTTPEDLARAEWRVRDSTFARRDADRHGRDGEEFLEC